MMKYTEMVELRKRLRDWYTLKEANKWMHTVHPLLDGRAPIACDKKEVERVIEMEKSI